MIMISIHTATGAIYLIKSQCHHSDQKSKYRYEFETQKILYVAVLKENHNYYVFSLQLYAARIFIYLINLANDCNH